MLSRERQTILAFDNNTSPRASLLYHIFNKNCSSNTLIRSFPHINTAEGTKNTLKAAAFHLTPCVWQMTCYPPSPSLFFPFRAIRPPLKRIIPFLAYVLQNNICTECSVLWDLLMMIAVYILERVLFYILPPFSDLHHVCHSLLHNRFSRCLLFWNLSWFPVLQFFEDIYVIVLPFSIIFKQLQNEEASVFGRYVLLCVCMFVGNFFDNRWGDLSIIFCSKNLENQQKFKTITASCASMCFFKIRNMSKIPIYG